MTSPHFSSATPEEAIAAWVRAGSRSEQFRAALLALLPEQVLLYAGRSTNETTRIRGHILATFERIGLPTGVLPYVIEELESGRDAYLVAAAAKAIRGGHVSDCKYLVPFLNKAIRNMQYLDSPVSFETYKALRWPVAQSTTALREIQRTLAWLNIDEEKDTVVDCCDTSSPVLRTVPVSGSIATVELEDQDGKRLRFSDFFVGRPSIVVFFYSRCDNPNKCSLTIAGLARLQEALDSGNLKDRVALAAITYDPLYDGPARLRSFGEHRGVRFGESVRFFRSTSGLDTLRAHFDLGANFIGSIVNRHRIELFILDARGAIVGSFNRLHWDRDTVLQQVEVLVQQNSVREPAIRGVAVSVLSGVVPGLIALLPKCPLCLGAYMAALGVGGLQLMPSWPWLLPALTLIMFVQLFFVFQRSKRSGRRLPLAVSICGSAAVLAGSVFLTLPVVASSGVALIVFGSLVNSIPRNNPLPPQAPAR